MNKKYIDQLDLGVQKKQIEVWYVFLNWLDRIEKGFSVMPFWRTSVNALSFISIIFSILGSLIVNLGWGNQISENVPVFYSNKLMNWTTMDKVYLYILSLFIWVVQFEIFYLSFKIFPSDKRLSVIINIFLTISSILFLITVSQIYTLQLI